MIGLLPIARSPVAPFAVPPGAARRFDMAEVHDDQVKGEAPTLHDDVLARLLVGQEEARKGREEARKLLVTLASEVQGLKEQLSALADQVSGIDSRVERQERRLEAIETFPSPPIRQSPRLYGTDAESVSLPLRVRVGWAG